jgi:HSP20 family protein
MSSQRKRPDSLLVSLARGFQQTQWRPSVDVYRTAGGWLLKFELAGVRPQEVEVTLSGSRLSVRGMRRDIRIEDCQQSHCMEISYNEFERVVELPGDASSWRVATDYRDGMLIVRLTT